MPLPRAARRGMAVVVFFNERRKVRASNCQSVRAVQPGSQLESSRVIWNRKRYRPVPNENAGHGRQSSRARPLGAAMTDCLDIGMSSSSRTTMPLSNAPDAPRHGHPEQTVRLRSCTAAANASNLPTRCATDCKSHLPPRRRLPHCATPAPTPTVG